MNQHRAFTLVEILIVVAILGILAAIVIPKFSQASDTARANASRTQLNTIRVQLQAWQADHGGEFPTLAAMQQGVDDWGALILKTDPDGAFNPAGAFGPYLSAPPINPFTGSTLVVDAGAPVANAGWTYDEDTGFARIILPTNVNPATDTELGPDDFEQP